MKDGARSPTAAGAESPPTGRPVWRLLLALAAADSLVWGLFWAIDPGRLFDFLGMGPRHDSRAWQFLTRDIPAPRDAALWHLLAFVALAHAGFLALAAWRPRSLGGLAVVPLIGHALGAALWAWALGAAATFPENRDPFAHAGPLWALLAHEVAPLALLIAFVLAWRRLCLPSPRYSGERGRG